MRMLIVEDDPDGREVLSEVFRIHDWTVTAVTTTHAALSELRCGRYDVVISDEDVEGESGSTMLCEASHEGLLRDVGALMYTAEAYPLEVPPGVRVLRKPLRVAALVSAATAIITSASEPRD